MPSVVTTAVDAVVPVVVDGDGLFALSWNEEGTPGFLIDREVATVLTPHDGEFGRLTGAPPGDDRIAATHELADMTGAVVLLKGPTTVVADPGGHTLLVTNGSERLATAGRARRARRIVPGGGHAGADGGRSRRVGACRGGRERGSRHGRGRSGPPDPERDRVVPRSLTGRSRGRRACWRR